MHTDFSAIARAAIDRARTAPPVVRGTLARVVGLTLEARGIVAPVGARCVVEGAHGARVRAEVVGFHDGIVYLMPFDDPLGISPGASVRVEGSATHVQVGPAMLGRVLDGLGQPLDGLPPPVCPHPVPLLGVPLNPMERGPIDRVLDVGIRAIDGLLTMGRGQRIGLVAGSGVGKSVLLGMMTRYTDADVVVIGLVGERGREVREFITDSLGPEGLARSVVIAAPANLPPVQRLKAAHLAHAVAEHFRDQGQSVLLLLDSLTRVAHAQREIGLAIGEPPTAKGYPPSVFSLLPNMIERAGVGREGRGSITAVYTVLAEGDDANDPIVDIARASLDGQVMLSRRLADAAHYPAIDLSGSVSRVMQQIVTPKDHKAANRFRRLWTLYQQSRDLIEVGAYDAGSNPELDEAIKLRLQLEHFLRQDMHERADYGESTAALHDLMGNP
jgi:flagellum-specific ATP synthase